MTKHANESLHPNYPKYQYNNKTTHSISKSYDSMQLTVKHFLQVWSSLKMLVNKSRYLPTGSIKKESLQISLKHHLYQWLAARHCSEPIPLNPILSQGQCVVVAKDSKKMSQCIVLGYILLRSGKANMREQKDSTPNYGRIPTHFNIHRTLAFLKET